MNPALAALLDHPIDYAGLFPPAKLALVDAVEEYTSFTGLEAELIDKFVCPASKLRELDNEVGEVGIDGAIWVSVVGSPIAHGQTAAKQVETDMAVSAGRNIEGAAYEVKVPHAEARSAASSVGRSAGKDVSVYFEFEWSHGWQDAMHEAVEAYDGIGFKARTGGVTADAFPTTHSVAEFIYLAVSFDAPFKFTAGLHEPLRYEDRDLGAWRHGFLNTLGASAAAMELDLTVEEIVRILEVTDPNGITFSESGMEACGHVVGVDGLAGLWEVFGGFGSCSVREPLEGLRRLGYLG